MAASTLVLAIDVGVRNLAMALVDVDRRRGKLMRIVAIELVDLTALRHRRVPRHRCALPHSAEMCDRIAHLVQEYDDEWFARADGGILIERQPLAGLKSVEQLLLATFRDRAELVHPCAVHAWARVAHQTYDERKRSAVARIDALLAAREAIADAAVRERWRAMVRAHDVADALMLVLYKLAPLRDAHRQAKRMRAPPPPTPSRSGIVAIRSVAALLETYRYVAPDATREGD